MRGLFSCFAFGGLIHIGLRAQPSPRLPFGSKCPEEGTDSAGSCLLAHNGSPGEPGSRREGPSHPGREMTKVNVGDAASAAKPLPPFSSCGHCYFPLTSCLQAPGRDKMGNTAAIHWRLMPEMSHTSEQLLPLRGTALNGQGAPLMAAMKEVQGKKSLTPPLKPSSESSFSPPFPFRLPILPTSS